MDMTEATDRGSVFEECAFRDVRFNVSLHEDTGPVDRAPAPASPGSGTF
ncbi:MULTISPECIES: hypothetical protein [unclassified Nonomuraea]